MAPPEDNLAAPRAQAYSAGTEVFSPFFLLYVLQDSSPDNGLFF